MSTEEESKRMARYYIRRKTRPAYQCLDCGKGVSGTGRRCIECARFERRPSEQKALGRNRRIDSGGYIRIKIDNKWMPEHRYIWESTYQQPLPKGWQVHHLDGDKTNNEIQNLYACSVSNHHSTRFFVKVLQDRIKGLQKELEDVKSCHPNHLL